MPRFKYNIQTGNNFDVSSKLHLKFKSQTQKHLQLGLAQNYEFIKDLLLEISLENRNKLWLSWAKLKL